MRNNIKLRIKNNLIIILVILLIFQLVIFIKPINISNSDSYRYEYNSDKMFYPGYKERIDAIGTPKLEIYNYGNRFRLE